jgi:peroxiredoxin Q/BCP
MIWLCFLLACGKTEVERWALGMPRVSAPAPEFTLPAYDGSMVSLSDFRGRRVVLYFYPQDRTPGCSLEAAAFRDRLGGIDSLGATVLGVSVDNAQSHQQFCQELALNFSLLSDTSGAVCRAYGTLGPDGRAHRSTFVIDERGNVRAVFPVVKVQGHVDEVLRVLRAMGPLRPERTP